MRRSILVLVFVDFITQSLSLSNQISESAIFKPDGSHPSDMVPNPNQPDIIPTQPCDVNPPQPIDGDYPQPSVGAGISSRRSRRGVRGAVGASSEGGEDGSGSSTPDSGSGSNGGSGNGRNETNGNGANGSSSPNNSTWIINNNNNNNNNNNLGNSADGVRNPGLIGDPMGKNSVQSQGIQGIGNNIGLGVGAGVTGVYGVGYPRVYSGYGPYPYGWIGSGNGNSRYCSRVGAYPLIDARRIYGGHTNILSRVRFPRRNRRLY